MKKRSRLLIEFSEHGRGLTFPIPRQFGIAPISVCRSGRTCSVKRTSVSRARNALHEHWQPEDQARHRACREQLPAAFSSSLVQPPAAGVAVITHEFDQRDFRARQYVTAFTRTSPRREYRNFAALCLYSNSPAVFSGGEKRRDGRHADSVDRGRSRYGAAARLAIGQ